ncbi:MAG: glycoside hydrolase family 15 protein, partial [archaeon]
MTRPIILGNGNMLVCLDKHARIRDFYYPYVGQENHVSSNRHLIGIWVDKNFSWVSQDDWDMSMNYKKDTLVSEVIAYNNKLKIELVINEAVHHKKNILLRHVHITNKGDSQREVKLFFSQHFQISETSIGGTVYYNPNLKSIINYKGKRYFLIGGMSNGKDFDDYATGVVRKTRNRIGTYVDAEDGTLSKNSIEHGSVDSTIGFTLDIKKDETKEVDYWIAVGKKYSEINSLKEFIIEQKPLNLIKETSEYWKKWAHKKKVDFFQLDEKIKELFIRSLLIVKAQTDNHGAIIAANDTHTFHFKKDTYSYMWPRDGALVARSLDRVGHEDITRKFFKFCSKLISDEGFLFHKYSPDGSLGSSWHSWLKGDKLQLPIQEDETALMLDSLWKHYHQHKDEKVIKNMYKSFILPVGNFLLNFRDKKTGLPKESYDLWEEKLGVHTFTCSTVCAGLEAAKNFAEIFGDKANSKKYRIATQEVREAMIKYLYDKEEKVFIKGIYYDN